MDVDAIFSRHGLTRAQVVAALGVTDDTMRHWRRGSRRISPPHVILAEQKLGIPRHELRPDLWPPPTKARPKTLRAVA